MSASRQHVQKKRATTRSTCNKRCRISLNIQCLIRPRHERFFGVRIELDDKNGITCGLTCETTKCCEGEMNGIPMSAKQEKRHATFTLNNSLKRAIGRSASTVPSAHFISREWCGTICPSSSLLYRETGAKTPGIAQLADAALHINCTRR